MVELTNVTKRYDDFVAIRDISIFVPEGEIIGLLGPNGAGKTTIMKIICGYHNPHSGTVRIADHNIIEDPVLVKSKVGYLPETTPLYDDLLVYEYLQFIGRSRGITLDKLGGAIKSVIHKCGMEDFAYKQIANLSKGMRQRVGLGQAIIHDPSVIILDEPTSGLDPNQIKEVRKVIQDLGKTKTIMLSTHILQEVEALCNRIFIVNEGRVVAEGTNEEISQQLKGEDTYTLEIPGAIDESVLDGLKKLEGVHLVDHVKSTEESTTLQVSGASDLVRGEHLFEWARNAKLKLRELHQKSASLESIFEKLTKQVKEEK